ncbi:leucine rich repeat variant [Calothrix parasitica NIES-267]|uniref:Leucine rich repeat variant n=1 Tax=Calothrix parasitica NIES-267 TaxID=1973488 RepID=A0A1Z4LN08_9CYAN|nr:leucine rich repeat variant [Calothrix parasitica NIES-267]
MSEQPREFDAVLGGKTPPPVTGVVLGGIEGVKRRLESEIIDVRIKALSDGLKYGDEGLDLVIEALENDSLQVKGFASRLLKKWGGEKGKQALLEFDPYLYFTKLEDWEVEEFNPEVGIVNPENKAYVVNLDKLQLLIQDERVNEVEALICYLQDYDVYYEVSQEYDDLAEFLYNHREKLENLKALFVGDAQIDEFRKSYLGIGEITHLLSSFPNLEVLHLRGCCNELCSGVLGHNNLKTLVIETRDISDMSIKLLCSLNLPALEYFELWIGRDFENTCDNVIKSIKPILFSESFPNLSYLGIRSCEYADAVAEAITESSFMADFPVIDNLFVLDLSMGNLTDEGLDNLIGVTAISNLHTLNVSHNCVSQEFLEGVEHLLLHCWVISDYQEEIVDRGVGISRYSALHE